MTDIHTDINVDIDYSETEIEFDIDTDKAEPEDFTELTRLSEEFGRRCFEVAGGDIVQALAMTATSFAAIVENILQDGINAKFGHKE